MNTGWVRGFLKLIYELFKCGALIELYSSVAEMRIYIH
jgi:hypothetical protein